VAAIANITTGEQTKTTTGAITGSLDTSAKSGDYTVKARFKLDSGQKAVVALEDTANVTPFSDAVQVAIFHVVGGQPADGSYHERKNYDIPGTRFGVTNSALRLNVLSISGGTLTAFGWLEQ